MLFWHLKRYRRWFSYSYQSGGVGRPSRPAERMQDFRMSRQDVGESQAAPGTARPGGPAEILKQRRHRAAAGGQDGSPGSRGRGDWRPLVGRPHGAD